MHVLICKELLGAMRGHAVNTQVPVCAVRLPVPAVVEKVMLRRALSGLQEVMQIFLLFFPF